MSDQIKPNKKALMRRGIWILLALALLLTVVTLLALTEDTADISQADASPVLQSVSVLDLAVSDVTASVETFAEVRPRWSADIRAAVSGRIVEVREAALAGAQVPAGAVLFQIESIQYDTAVAAAELLLAEAQLALLQAENKTTISRLQFERDSARAPNDLALHIPELRIAERQVASADAQLHAAQRQRDDTVITAPFSGFITERLTSLGQTVASGEPLVKLVDDKQFEMTAELSRESWGLLDHPINGQVAQLVDTAGTPIGTATVRQGGGFLDQNTRQYRVFLEVNETTGQSILSGDFLRVLLTGRVVKDTMSIPDTALTRTGHVWFVDQNDQLMRLAPDILFRLADQIVIAAPAGGQRQRVAITPLASFLPGQRVAPHSVKD
ncbi:efflux RND transporter periplasmic adaptor subunit [Thalassobius sp. I31.1]|uniref:efflux RND transporter periplasmic adaptor subunit n=1 Tax=Thalassobius sp. I31.1 TaxID=2109912 RepID=UPI000D1B99DF|nr:efflux RND transporter periplasmic adaptor subunit [Thalassobius sp. I31.1]